MKKLMIAALKEAARAAVSAFLAALGLAASVSATGCTTVVLPDDQAHCVSLTGAIPVGIPHIK